MPAREAHPADVAAGPDERAPFAVGDEGVFAQDVGDADVGQPVEVGASHAR